MIYPIISADILPAMSSLSLFMSNCSFCHVEIVETSTS